jgi:hypothetical protein
MTFHRKSLPSYFIAGGGTLLSGYDLINTPSDPSVGGSGTPAPVDGKKSGGANDGTYFVAFTEDGTAAHANRPANALADNTDALDDIVRASIPRLANIAATASGSTTTIALTGEIFVGEFGLANNSTNRNLIARITDQSNNDLEVSGTKISANLIHNGSGVNVVGTAADGFRTNASVDFSPAIPNGTAYRVWYGIRSSLAEISKTQQGAYLENQIRAIEHLPANARALFRQLHSETAVNQAYDAAWDSTIRSLASAGLNERYRRATTQPIGFVTGQYNTPGDGATITRDGKAFEVRSADLDIVANTYPDPQLADIRTAATIARGVLSSFNQAKGGDIGYIHESEAVYQSFTAEASRDAISGPGFMDIVPRDIRDNLTSTVFTFINPGSTGLLNPASGGTDTARRTLQCAAGQYFRNSGSTSLRVGVDLVEVVYLGRPPETYVVQSLVSDTQVLVTRLNGSIGTIFPSTATSVTIRWLQVSMLFGGTGNVKGIAGSEAYQARRFMYLQPAPLTASVGSMEAPAPAGFFSALSSHGSNLNAGTAMVWGNADPAGAGPTVTGTLFGDGTVSCVNGTFSVMSAGSGTTSTTFGVGTDLTVGGTAVLGSTLTVANGITTLANDIVAADDLVAGDDVLAGDRVSAVGTVSGLASFDTQPEFFYKFRDDFVSLTVGSSPNLVTTTDRTWEYNPILDTFTIGKGSSSAKNPGVMAIVGTGGATHRQISIFTSDRVTYGFSNIEHMTVVLMVVDDPANAGADFLVGFVQDETTTLGGTDVLRVQYSALTHNWALKHRKGNATGVNNGVVLGSYVSGDFVTCRFNKLTTGDVEVYFNDVLKTTILSANLPNGLGTFAIYCEQDGTDSGVTTFSCDLVDFRVSTGANRNGP